MHNYLHRRVMIVDDSKLDRFIATSAIERNEFAEEIVSFGSGIDALEYLHSLKNPSLCPEVIFLDINMPVMNGFEFLNDYMKLPPSIQKRSSIIMISSSESSDDFRKIKAYPCIEMFFSKPFSPSILTTIRKHDEAKSVH